MNREEKTGEKKRDQRKTILGFRKVTPCVHKRERLPERTRGGSRRGGPTRGEQNRKTGRAKRRGILGDTFEVVQM